MGNGVAQENVDEGHERRERGDQHRHSEMACAERRLGHSAHPFLIQTLMRCVLSLDVRPLPGVSPIEPAHPPFKNVDALTCPGHGHGVFGDAGLGCVPIVDINERSEEHTSELQSLIRISYAASCLKKKTM